ncbi:hypothetical protein B484DRAFT_441933 [Ochromonadaceae sp. CCMP2298]|nr:hypothetical protein B484DRAFT_441933 [Ochromonadaceae sp. CCMP2298]
MSWILAVETHRHKSIGTLLRCASAFGARCVVIVGSPQYSTHGAIGAQRYMEVVHFYYWNECLEYCREAGCSVAYGISPRALISSSGFESDCADSSECEGAPDAQPGSTSQSVVSADVDTFPFLGPACFIVGERTGLTEEQLCISQAVLHVQVPVSALQESLPYDTKVALCLQRYAELMGLQASSHSGEKHLLAKVDHARRGAYTKAGRANAKREPGEGEGEGVKLGEGAEDLALLGVSFFLAQAES